MCEMVYCVCVCVCDTLAGKPPQRVGFPAIPLKHQCKLQRSLQWCSHMLVLIWSVVVVVLACKCDSQVYRQVVLKTALGREVIIHETMNCSSFV